MRLWSAQEANDALPGVRDRLHTAQAAARDVKQAQAQMDDLRTAYGPQVHQLDHPSHHEWEAWRSKRTQAEGRLQATLAWFRDAGVVLKDIELGLVDFHADHLGRVVFLCWQDGEPAVEHWHPLEGGFAKRQALPKISGV